MIEVRNVRKTYGSFVALRDASLDVEAGQYVAIMGPSGSGKSTLLHLMAGLDEPDEGAIEVCGMVLNGRSEMEKAQFRRQHIGLVFQFFHLLEELTVLSNVMLPGLLSQRRPVVRKRAVKLLGEVGLREHQQKHPSQLSGGEQQRVALARALVNEPALLLADEPTGNLDSKSGKEIMAILQRLNREQGITIVMVTHDPVVSAYSDRIVKLRDGRIVAVEEVQEPRVALDEGVVA